MRNSVAKKLAQPENCAAGSGGDDSADRRAGDNRLMTILRVGKLIVGEGVQELCLIRNISEGGLMAHVYSSHEVGDRVRVELRSDTQVAGTIRWVRDDNVGVEFDENVDVAGVLSHHAPEGQKPRAPRLDIRGVARLKIGEDFWRVEVRDLSQGGARVIIDVPLQIGEEAVITIDGLRSTKAIVRWQDDSQAGLEFIPRLPFDELIAWLALRGGERQAVE